MPFNSTYLPTFLEKLLGRNYKWWYILKYEVKRSTTSLFNDSLWFLARIITFFLSIFIWSLSGRKDSSEIISYLIVGNLLLSSLMPMVLWEISNDIYEGKLVTKLLAPTNIKIRYFFESLPNSLKNFCIIFVIILPCLFIFPNSFVFSLSIFWLIPLVLIAYLIRFFIDMLSALTTFWLTRTYGVNDFHVAILPFLAGSLFPLSLLPIWLYFIEFQPLAFTFYHPMQIYLGKYSTNEIILVFIGGLAWCLVLYFLAKLVFKLGLKRNESVGL
jgi:ABC-2 type transport system permease protein